MSNNDYEKIVGIHYETGEPIEIRVENGLISQIREYTDSKADLAVIAPGLVDLQINGFAGIDFNQSPLNLSEWKTVSHKLAEVGVTTFYPTIITNSFLQLAEIMKAIKKEVDEALFPVQMIGGIHLEGPYISLEDGPRGAHAREFVRPPDWKEFDELQRISGGMIKIVTLSPEWQGSSEFIRKAVKSGVKVAIGHTAADTGKIHEAVMAGASLSTHLGNGAHPNLPRHPNYIWDQLAESDLWSSVISDGHHLPANVLKVFNHVKKNKMILVSDSVALAGLEPGDYNTPVGGEVTLTENGRLHLKDAPELLAGSAQYLLQGVQHLVKSEIVGFSEALNKASIYPSELLNLPQQKSLNVGAPADLILLNKSSEAWKVMKTFKNGKQVFGEGSS